MLTDSMKGYVMVMQGYIPDILSNLERIGDHSVNIATYILED